MAEWKRGQCPLEWLLSVVRGEDTISEQLKGTGFLQMGTRFRIKFYHVNIINVAYFGSQILILHPLSYGLKFNYHLLGLRNCLSRNASA